MEEIQKQPPFIEHSDLNKHEMWIVNIFGANADLLNQSSDSGCFRQSACPLKTSVGILIPSILRHTFVFKLARRKIRSRKLYEKSSREHMKYTAVFVSERKLMLSLRLDWLLPVEKTLTDFFVILHRVQCKRWKYMRKGYLYETR